MRLSYREYYKQYGVELDGELVEQRLEPNPIQALSAVELLLLKYSLELLLVLKAAKGDEFLNFLLLNAGLPMDEYELLVAEELQNKFNEGGMDYGRLFSLSRLRLEGKLELSKNFDERSVVLFRNWLRKLVLPEIIRDALQAPLLIKDDAEYDFFPALVAGKTAIYCSLAISNSHREIHNKMGNVVSFFQMRYSFNLRRSIFWNPRAGILYIKEHDNEA